MAPLWGCKRLLAHSGRHPMAVGCVGLGAGFWRPFGAGRRGKSGVAKATSHFWTKIDHMCQISRCDRPNQGVLRPLFLIVRWAVLG